MEWPIAKLPERYIGGRLSILLNLRCKLGDKLVEWYALLSQVQGDDQGGKFDAALGIAQDKRLVFIRDVHLVQDQERLITNTVGGFVGLKAVDELTEHRMGDPLYHSVITGKFLFLGWAMATHGELDKRTAFSPILLTGKLPHQIVQGRAKVVNDLPREDAEAERDGALSVIIDCLEHHLAVILGDAWVIAFLKEPLDLKIEIADILVGPF